MSATGENPPDEHGEGLIIGDDDGVITYPRTDGSEIDEAVAETASRLGIDVDLAKHYADVTFISDELLMSVPYDVIRADLILASDLVAKLEALLASSVDPSVRGKVIEALRRARAAASAHRAIAHRKAWLEDKLFDLSRQQFGYAYSGSASRAALDAVLQAVPQGKTTSPFRSHVEHLGMEGGSRYIGWAIGKSLDGSALVSFTGRNTFNGFYLDHEIRSVYVLEAKGGGSHLGYAGGYRQGTSAYFEHTLGKMQFSPNADRRAAADEVLKAYVAGYDLRYVGVRTQYAPEAPLPEKIFDVGVFL